MKTISTARAKRLREYAKLKRKFLSEKQRCDCCKKPNLSLSVHHSRGRIGRLLNMTEFWFAVCQDCHHWIHANPKCARYWGLLCEAGQWNTVPK